MSHDLSVSALIPDNVFGLSVVDVEELLRYLAEGESLEEAITNASFDSVEISPRATPEQRWNVIEDAVTRLRALNETGDAAAYWDRH
jgi:hypothetical protein